jgi:DMSO/TMAO reductase YedYZ molybdopterin-dependent catalytic subunit
MSSKTTTSSTDRVGAAAGGTPHRPPLPPGQWRIDRFPRFGTDLTGPPPPVPADPAVVIGGAVIEPFVVTGAELTTLPRRRLDADFHCVSGWTASDLHWDGVAFADLYRLRIEPALPSDAVVTHLEFRGLDGFRSVVLLEDALDGDVLLADHLGGEPLSADHGAPLRLVSPAQYGYISTKHLCRIDVHTSPPGGPRSFVLDVLLHSHPRARVWEEERHGSVPGRVIRPLYRIVGTLMLRRTRSGSRTADVSDRRDADRR